MTTQTIEHRPLKRQRLANEISMQKSGAPDKAGAPLFTDFQRIPQGHYFLWVDVLHCVYSVAVIQSACR
jgi:hypothetical protein